MLLTACTASIMTFIRKAFHCQTFANAKGSCQCSENPEKRHTPSVKRQQIILGENSLWSLRAMKALRSVSKEKESNNMNHTTNNLTGFSIFESLEQFEKAARIQEIAHYAKEHLAELMGMEGTVRVDNVTKNNGVILTTVTFLPKGQNVGTVDYADKYSEMKPDKAVQEMAIFIKEHVITEYVDGKKFFEKEFAKKHLRIRLVNYERNIALLNKVPHRRVWGDLAIYAAIKVEDSNTLAGFIGVKNEHLELMEMTVDEIIDTAISNSGSEIVVTDMMDFMNMGGMCYPDIPMKIVTNDKNLYGAGCILKDMKKFGNEYYIIPSTIHELIVVDSSLMNERVTDAMIKDINATMVQPEDILSNHLYHVVNGEVVDY